MTDVPRPVEPIQYATPQTFQRPSRLVAAVWLGAIGLALIFAAGGFMIAVLMVREGTPLVTSSARIAFYVVTLYFMAFSCFGIALVMVLKGVWTLFKLAVG